MKSFSYLVLLLLLAVTSCKNRDVNPIYNETLPMHERKPIDPNDFDTVVIDGAKYYIMERDRNNPHEGFGFMALSDEKMRKKQDSIMAYQKLMLQNQIRILEKLEGVPAIDLEVEMQQKLDELLNQ